MEGGSSAESFPKLSLANFNTLTGFAINDTDVVINRVSAGNDFIFAVYSKTYTPGLKHVTIFPAENNDEASFLSSTLGVDESLRKMISEIMPKSIKGVIIVNGSKGVMVVITRPTGGISGKDGVIRTVEYIYKFPQESYVGHSRLSVIPMVYEEDFQTYPREVYEVARDFSSTFMREVELINNKRFANLERVFNEIDESLSKISEYVTNVNRKFYDDLEQSNIDGLLFNEYPLLKIQTMLESARSALASQKI